MQEDPAKAGLACNRLQRLITEDAMYKSSLSKKEEEFTLRAAVQIMRDARTMLRVGENSWSGKVISPLLNLALQDDADMYYFDISSAKMAPEFKPEVDGLLAGKMVDFVMGIIPSRTEGKLVTKLCQRTPSYTISPTTQSVRAMPVAVSIEVKVNTVGGQPKSFLQLGTWCVAQLKVWEILRATRALSETLLLPLLSIQGARWFLLILECEPDGSKVCRLKTDKDEYCKKRLTDGTDLARAACSW